MPEGPTAALREQWRAWFQWVMKEVGVAKPEHLAKRVAQRLKAGGFPPIARGTVHGFGRGRGLPKDRTVLGICKAFDLPVPRITLLYGAAEQTPALVRRPPSDDVPEAGWEAQLLAQLVRQREQMAQQHAELMEAVRSLAGNEPRASGA